MMKTYWYVINVENINQAQLLQRKSINQQRITHDSGGGGLEKNTQTVNHRSPNCLSLS